MSGRHSFNKLKDSMSTRSQERTKKKLKQLRQEMALAEVRKAMSLTQTDLGEMLHIKQAALARLENRTDMYISSLRKYIVALGESWISLLVFLKETFISRTYTIFINEGDMD